MSCPRLDELARHRQALSQVHLKPRSDRLADPWRQIYASDVD